MKNLSAIIFICSILLGCNAESFKKDQKAAIGSANNKSTRPQETGEGLPGYMFCRASEPSDRETNLTCRLEENQTKVDISNRESQWQFTSEANVEITSRLLTNEDLFHVEFTILGEIAARNLAVAEGKITITLDGTQYGVPSAVAVDGGFNSQVKFLFGPGVSGQLEDWLGLNLDAPTADPLTSSMGTSLGNIELELKPGEGQLLPQSLTELSGPSPWLEMARSAISANQTIELLVKGLQPGSYNVKVFTANTFLTTNTSEIAIQFSKDGKFSDPQSIKMDKRLDATSVSSDDLGEFRFVSTEEFHIKLIHTSGGAVSLHSLVIGKID